MSEHIWRGLMGILSLSHLVISGSLAVVGSSDIKTNYLGAGKLIVNTSPLSLTLLSLQRNHEPFSLTRLF